MGTAPRLGHLAQNLGHLVPHFGRFARNIAADHRGAIAPLLALMIAVLGGFAGLAVDLGMVFHERKRLGAAVDIAALAAVRSKDPQQSARLALSENGYRDPLNLSVGTGYYDSNRAVASTSRYRAGGTPANAARVKMESVMQAGFSRLVGGPPTFTVSAVATALNADFASFGIGSRLVELDGGVANALLSALVGTSVSAYGLDYRSLANVKLDALTFLKAAAVRGNITAVTYDDILKANLSSGTIAGALVDAVRESGAASNVLAFLNAVSTGPLAGRNLSLGSLVTLGEGASAVVGRGGASLGISLPDILSEMAALANGENQVAVDLASAPAGLARVRITLRGGEKWRSSGFVRPGASLETAQVRVLVEVWIPLPVGLGSIHLPVYVEAAQATAQLKTVSCSWSSRDQRSATLDVTTGAVSLAITDTPWTSLSASSVPRPLAPAQIVSTPLVSINASANSTIASSRQNVSFSDSDISTGRVRTVSSQLGSPTRALLSGLSLNIGGLQGDLGGVGDIVKTTLGLAAPAIDTVLASALDVAGVRIGAADVAIEGARCDGAVLVQ